MVTWIVGAAVACILALAVFKLICDRNSGKSCASCGGCGECSAQKTCKNVLRIKER